MRESLEDVRARGLMMRPVCSYVVKFVERYNEFADLVA
jgi:predicted GNAT family acetyltransferase